VGDLSQDVMNDYWIYGMIAEGKMRYTDIIEMTYPELQKVYAIMSMHKDYECVISTYQTEKMNKQ